MTHIKKMIRDQLRTLISEKKDEQKPEKDEDPAKEQKPKKKKKKGSMAAGTISTKGAFGSGGRPTRFLLNQKARATNDPEGLLKDLGVTSKASGGDSDQARSILNQSIHANSLMARAYVGARSGTGRTVEGEVISQAVIITVGDLSKNDGVRFLANVLEAAKNAGFLNLSGGLQFVQGAGSTIIVYSP